MLNKLSNIYQNHFYYFRHGAIVATIVGVIIVYALSPFLALNTIFIIFAAILLLLIPPPVRFSLPPILLTGLGMWYFLPAEQASRAMEALLACGVSAAVSPFLNAQLRGRSKELQNQITFDVWSELENSQSMDKVLEYTTTFLRYSGASKVVLYQRREGLGFIGQPNFYPLYALSQCVGVLEVENIPEYLDFGQFLSFVSGRLDRLTREQEVSFLNYAALEIQDASVPKEGVERVFRALINFKRYTSCQLFMYHKDRFAHYAQVGSMGDLDAILKAGLPFGEGVVWRAYNEQRALFIQNYAAVPDAFKNFKDAALEGLAVLPLEGLGMTRAFMVAVRPGTDVWTSEEQEFLNTVARNIAMLFQRDVLGRRLENNVKLMRNVLHYSAGDLYQALLVQTIDMVPGATLGVFLGLEGDTYQVLCSSGLLNHAAQVHIPKHEVQIWMGQNVQEARIERSPRLLERVDGLKNSAIADLMPLSRIKSDLMLPIWQEDTIKAILWLANVQDKQAFDEDSIEVLDMVGTQVSIILREAQTNITDRLPKNEMTKLPNQEAFYLLMENSILISPQPEHPFSLLFVRLGNLSHFPEEGKVAIFRNTVGILQNAQRNTDILFHWDSDVIAIFLNETNQVGANAAATRMMGKISAHLPHVVLRWGVSSYPQDAQELSALVSMAQNRLAHASSA